MSQPLILNNFEMIEAYADITYRTFNRYIGKDDLLFNEERRTNQIQIYCNIKSTQTIILNGKKISTVPGDIIIIPDWCPITILTMDEDAQHNILQYHPGIFMRSEILLPHYEQSVTNIRKYGGMIIHPSKAQYKKLVALMDKYDNHRGFGFEIMRFSTILQIIEIIGEFTKSLPQPDYNPPKALEAVDFINRHFDEDIQLEDIANAMNMTVRHMGVIFKEFTQTTPKQYIDYLRISIAKLTIKTYEANINDAFLATGYTTYSSFYRTFLKFTGKTPEDYRKYYYNNPKTFYNEEFLKKANDEVSEDYR